MNKYTRIEYERRFLVDPRADWKPALKPYTKLLTDRYLSCGRLRLRRLEDSDSDRVVFKLTKKFESETPYARECVGTWLSASEIDALSALAGFGLRKRRHYQEWNGIIFSIDVFEGELQGLLLCETEQADSIESLRAIQFPPYAKWEVTEDPFFTGGQLCRASRHQLEAAVEQLTASRAFLTD